VALAGTDVVRRVDIVHIDRLANRIVSEAGFGKGQRLADDRTAGEWAAMLREIPGTTWDAEFLDAEWSQIILGQAITSRAEYFRARRPGRGRPLSRAERDEVWQLCERFTQRLADRNVVTFRQIAERAARLEMQRAEQALAQDADPENTSSRYRHRYRHVVIDEAQDLNRRTGRCCGRWSHRASTTCSSPGTRISASTASTSHSAASG
jgi:hypothetical protein